MIKTTDIVKLLQLKGLGKGKITKLVDSLSFMPTCIDDYYDILTERQNQLKLPDFTRTNLEKAFEMGESIIEKSNAKNITIVSIYDFDYPKKLKSIENAPLIINVIGDLKKFNELPSVAVIGTRQPSIYGMKIGERLGAILGENKFNVVSGLAKGCDAAGHIGCLSVKGTTTAVLAHGLDHIYPKENKQLAESIVENNGYLVSEYFIGTKPFNSFFIERDRIQAGLSDAIIVVETDIKGGTMHTVNYAFSYNRIVSAYNHPEKYLNEKSNGNQFLIKQKSAFPISNSEDITVLIEKIKPKIDYFSSNNKIISLTLFDNVEETPNEAFLSLTKPSKKTKSNSGTKRKKNKSNPDQTEIEYGNNI